MFRLLIQGYQGCNVSDNYYGIACNMTVNVKT